MSSGNPLRVFSNIFAQRAASTISREVARNGGIRRYRAEKAVKRAWKLALRPKPCELVLQVPLRQAVVLKLETRHRSKLRAG